MKQVKLHILFIVVLLLITIKINAQQTINSLSNLDTTQKSIISISSYTAKGDIENVRRALNTGLDAGLTINQIKEVLVHLYAYCGFPRSIRGLQIFMEVLEERKTKGITDTIGKQASPIHQVNTKYERGKKVLGELTGIPQPDKVSGYSAFAPVIDIFLKEHLFADIFERDVLTYAQRELVTISVIATIGNAEPMLQAHFNISLNVGINAEQLREFVSMLSYTAGEEEARAAHMVLENLLKSKK